MNNSICYCGNQCDGDDKCFCDECNGIKSECTCVSHAEADILDYEDDIPYIKNK